MKEIVQPIIQLPEKNDPLRWAKESKVMNNWMGVVAPQLAMDTEKILLGNVLANIIGDDSNIFNYYIPEYIDTVKPSILERLNFEIDTPELPNHFRNKLIEVKNTIESTKLNSKKEWSSIRNIWFKTYSWIKDEVNKTPELIDAINYHSEQMCVLSPYWRSFYNVQNLISKSGYASNNS